MNKTTEPAAPEPLSLGNTKGIHTQAVVGLELIYQVWNTSDYPSHWADTDKILYDAYAKDDRRIVYSAATVERLVQECNGWIDSAKHFSNGMEYYRDQLDACARHIGLPCFTADDGGVHEEPLRAKVTEEVQRLVQERDEARKEAEKQYSMVLEGASLLIALKEEYALCRKLLMDRIHDMMNARHNLAASQAREQQLREALSTCQCYSNKQIAAALSLPQDDSALRQWGAKLLREMADEYAHGAKDADKDSRVFLSEANARCAIHLRRKADELKGK